VDGTRLLGTRVATAEHAAHTTESSASAAAAEELCEQVLGSHSSATTHSAALLEALLTILVVNLALLRVREYFICVGNLLELFLGFGRVCVLIGVVLQGAFAVCGFELGLGSVGSTAERVVELGVLDHDCGLWSVRTKGGVRVYSGRRSRVGVNWWTRVMGRGDFLEMWSARCS
jgi:hypothetical protein